MKMTLILILAVTLLAASSALAGDNTKAKDPKKAKTKAVDEAKAVQSSSAEQKGRVLLTGSYTKQNVRRSGLITDGGNQVIVLDSDTIERSGATGVKQLLSRQGIH